MSCTTYETELLDLLYEELDERKAKELRAHLVGCASCAASFAKLSSGKRFAARMQMEEPPVGLDAKLLALAEEKVRTGTGGARRSERATADHEGWWPKLLRSLGGFAMGPQVAMATLLLLMVTMGLYYLPRLRRQSELGPVAAVNPDPAGEAAPSAIQPAQPLDLRIDPRTGRIRESAGGANVAPGTKPPAPPTTATLEAMPAANAQEQGATAVPTGVEAQVAQLEAPAEPEVTADARDRGALTDHANEGELAQAEPAARAERAEEGLVVATGRGAQGGGAGSDPLAPERTVRAAGASSGGAGAAPPGEAVADGIALQPRSGDFDPQPSRSTNFGGAPSTAAQHAYRDEGADVPQQVAARAPVATVPQAPAAAPMPTPAALVADEERRAPTGAAATSPASNTRRSGAVPAAADVAPEVSRRRAETAPDALHAMARNQMNAGALGAATTQYESLLARYPTYSGITTATFELAECYRRLGRLSQARTLLARLSNASTGGSTATRARRELVRVEEAMRATTRPVSAGATTEAQ